MKRTTALCLAVVLGIGCGFVGVWFGESRPYPEAPILADGDALRAFMSDATLRDTQNWILENYILDREEDVTQVEIRVRDDEDDND